MSAEKKPERKYNFAALRTAFPRLLVFAVPFWRQLGIGMIALALASGVNLLFPHLVRRLLNNELGLELERDLPYFTLLLIALFALQGVCLYVRHYCFQTTGYRVVASLRSRLYAALSEQDISFYDKARLGDLLSRLSADTQLLQTALSFTISTLVRYTVQVIGGFILMTVISWKLMLVIVVLVPLVVGATKYWGAKLRQLSKLVQTQIGDANALAEESLGAAKIVRIFAGVRAEQFRFGAAVQQALDTGIVRAKFAALFVSLMVFLIHASIAVVIWYGGELVLRSQLSLGDLTAFLLYCIIVAVSFGFFINALDDFLQAAGAAERIFEILDSKPTIVSPPDPKPINPHSETLLAFHDLSFAYPSRPDRLVLRDVSFELKRGTTLALVGPSGSGKSTIASLIPRFYDPTAGEILYSGTPLKDLALEDLRSEISIVPQDPHVFAISLAENIRYGRLNATDDEVHEAAEAANLTALIAGLPQGYQTLAGPRGAQLSGGEKQRLAIARAILKNPKLLILDEATSALDSENEQLVQQALQRLMQQRTTIIIAHRLSTVQHADLVLVIKDGVIVQRGTHESLMSASGLYRTLVEYQLL